MPFSSGIAVHHPFQVERGLTGDRLHHCLSVLNDKRSHILDPCYSLQRLINARRKHWFSMKKYQYLDLAHLDAKILPPPPREYKVYTVFEDEYDTPSNKHY